MKARKSPRVRAASLVTMALAAWLAQGCSKSSSSVSDATACSTTVTSLQSGICAAQSAMSLAPHFSDSSPTAFNFLPRLLRHGGFELARIFLPSALAGGSLSAFWTTSTADADLYGGGSYESPQDWMGQEMDANFTNSNGAATTPFGRADLNQFMACAIGAVTAESWSSSIDTDNLLQAGTYSASVSFPSSGDSFLGCTIPSVIQSSIYSMGTQTVQLTVSAVTGSTYTKAYAMSGGDTYYFKLDPTNHIMNMGVAKTSSTSAGWAMSRQLLAVNGGVTDFEYIEQSYCGGGSGKCTDTASLEGGNLLDSLEMYRFHIDTTNSKAYIYGSGGAYDDALASGDSSSNASESFTRYAMAGNPNDLNSIALSMSIAGEGSGKSFIAVDGGTPDDGGTACVSATDGSILSDSTLTCDVTGEDITGATSASGPTEASIIAEKDSSATNDGAVYKMDGNTAIPWSDETTSATTGMYGVATTTQ